MKIAVVAPTTIPARRANTVQVMKMTQALTRLGYSARLVSPGPPPNGRKPAWKELANHYGLGHSFPVEWLAVKPHLRRYDYGYAAVRWARAWGADLLYTRLPQAAVIAAYSGLATIFEVHDLPQGLAGGWLFRLFLSAPRARRLVVITRALADDLSRRFRAPAGPPFTVIAPDAVDLERYAGLPSPEEARRRILQNPKRPPLPITPARFTAGYTGHLYAGRGGETLLALAERLPGITFLVAGGEPPDIARLQAEANARELGNLVMAGFVPNAALPLYQAAGDVLLMPYQRRVAASSGGDISRYLSPMKLFEYLACGRPILCSDLPVLAEILDGSNAVLLPPDDLDAWTLALQALQDDPPRRAALSTAALHTASHHTWEARVERIFQ